MSTEMRGNHTISRAGNGPVVLRHRHQLASAPTWEQCPTNLATGIALLHKVKEPARAVASDRPELNAGNRVNHVPGGLFPSESGRGPSGGPSTSLYVLFVESLGRKARLSGLKFDRFLSR